MPADGFFGRRKRNRYEERPSSDDLGKLVVEQSLLNKKEKLLEEESKVIREHPLVGEDALKPALFDEEMLAVVRSHHERYDGLGYPDGLKGDNISISAQIVSVADSYDAMTSSRAYRPAFSNEVAINELKKNSGTQFNTQIVKAFLRVLESNLNKEFRMVKGVKLSIKCSQ